MERRDFIQRCSFACLGLLGASTLSQSCAPAKHLQLTAANNQLAVARKEFTVAEGSSKMRRHLIIKAEGISYPVILYRFSESEYSALLLQCTHQGIELNVNGDILTCAAHGSEFGNRGEIIQGPADQPLKQFKVTTDKDTLYIHLA